MQTRPSDGIVAVSAEDTHRLLLGGFVNFAACSNSLELHR
jgi:hypothetical protein